MQSPSKSPIVLIIGGGLGGLTLAHGLKSAGIDFKVFERDETANFRPQGYRIRINHDGSDALKKTLTPEHFDLFERTCAEIKLGISSFNPVDGTLNMAKGGADPSRDNFIKNNPGVEVPMPYTVDRATFRGVLLLGLEDKIFFGKKFEKYVETENGVTVYFADGTTEEGTLIVGADGVRSGVRRQYLPDFKPVDTEGRVIYGKTPLTKELEERFPADAMQWITLMMDKRNTTTPTFLFLEPVRFTRDVSKESEGKLPAVKDYIYWVLGARKSVFGMEDTELLSLGNKEAAEKSLAMTQDWNSAIRSLLELQDVNQPSTLRLCSMVTPIPDWKPSAHVTLLGDAAHVMPPTGGVGANTALKDAMNLCKIIVEEGITAESIGKYEDNMRVYAKQAVEQSNGGGKMMMNLPPLNECKPVEF